jgi:hypothetical protein
MGIRVAAVALACGLVAWASVEAEQAPAGTPDTALSAFDSAVIGQEALAFDLQATSAAYAQFDARIAQKQVVVMHDQQQIAAAKATPGPAADATIAKLNDEINAATQAIEALNQLKALVINDPQCGNGAKVQELQRVATLVSNQLTQMKPALASADNPQAQKAMNAPIPPGANAALIQNFRNNFQSTMGSLKTSYERYQSLQADLNSQLAIVQDACAEAKAEVQRGPSSEAMDHAGAAAQQAAGEARQMAAAGHFTDIPKIRQKLALVVEVARGYQIVGDSRSAALQQSATGIVTAFAQQAAKTCKQEPSYPGAVKEVARQIDALGGGVDLTPCLNRMFDVMFATDGVEFHMRRCDASPLGVWKVKTSPGSYWTIEGLAEIGKDGSGTMQLAGLGNDKDSLPYPVAVTGRLHVTEREEKMGDIVFSVQRMMNMDVVRAPITAMPKGGGMPTTHPGTAAQYNNPFVPVNNKACDPGADVWSFK